MKKVAALVTVLMVLFVWMGVGLAQEKKGDGKQVNQAVDKPGTISPAAKGVAALTLAGHLADYGRQNQNPMALVVAAQIMKKTNPKEEKREKQSEGAAGAPEAAGKKGSVDTPDSLLADAKKMAGENLQLAALIDKESKLAADRGRVGGEIKHVDTVKRNANDVYTIKFRGGELARIGLLGESGSSLALVVYDENGNLIERSNIGERVAYVEWTPSWTGSFKVKVINNSGSAVDYVLVSN